MAEKRVEELHGDLTSANADKEAYAQNAINLRERLERLKDQWNDYAKRSAELEALLRDVVDGKHTTPGWNQRMKAALDGSKAPSVTCNLARATDFVERLVYCAGTQQSVATGYLRDILEVLKGGEVPSDPVERDERADFLAWACREYEVGAEEELNERNVVVIQNWAGWKARAALDCPDCGDTGLEPCSKHGWKP
ncbi:hypothetical protein [Pseudomonas protegens]|uniref:hypothetical protein n=1 Tax=Pseudomonas protegens TaxID=380021 RepID=UPI0037F4AB39